MVTKILESKKYIIAFFKARPRQITEHLKEFEKKYELVSFTTEGKYTSPHYTFIWRKERSV